MFFPFKRSSYIPFICAKMKETVETFLVLVPTSFLQWAYYGVGNLPHTGIRKNKMMTREGRRKLTRQGRSQCWFLSVTVKAREYLFSHLSSYVNIAYSITRTSSSRVAAICVCVHYIQRIMDIWQERERRKVRLWWQRPIDEILKEIQTEK